ncbi:hypothetical protein E1263_05415 [Kribbella antibiotica]|uniref:Uncharacterized protein n=1 Tax=Kribbella antibiotica TaxID=190195 RepID=A0A4R4ZSM2_9ACTN|nr:hypothetical protein [Kribbella antibiotica]TDD62051.1 hypothetical protein E1263_05415 [Kribbella antibiotica]
MALRDTWFYASDSRVFDASVRTRGAYFASDYLGGLVVVGAITAAILLTGIFYARYWAAVIGVLIIVGLVAAYSSGQSAWAFAERQSAKTLTTGEFPYLDRVQGACRTSIISVAGRSYLAGQWAPGGGGMFGGVRCGSIDFYRGWKYILRSRLPTGDGIDYDFAFAGRTEASASYVVVVTSQAVSPAKSSYYIQGYPMSNPAKPWKHKVPSGPGEYSIAGKAMQLGPLIVVPEYWGKETSSMDEQTKLTALNAATGKLVWTVRCPRRAMTAGQAMQLSEKSQPIEISCRNASSGSAETYHVGVDGKLRLIR